MSETKLKPFDLEKALAGEDVVNGVGEKIKIIYFTKDDITYSILGIVDKQKWVQGDDIYDNVTSYMRNGKYIEDTEDHEKDLFMAPKMRKYYINLFQHHNYDILITSHAYPNKKEPSEFSNLDFIKQIEIEVEVE